MSKKNKKDDIIIPDKYITESSCSQFPECGGCNYQNVDYTGELEIKENNVKLLLSDANIDVKEFMGIVPAPNLSEYRNKMEFTFGDEEKDGKLQLGMRKKRSFYEVSDASDCIICDSDFRLIAKEIKEYFINETNETFYHKTRRTGTLRNVVIRKSNYFGEILVNIVTISGIASPLTELSHKLSKLKYKGILKGVLHTICDTVADAIKPDCVNVLFGQSFITESLLGLKFKISPFSFFQTNSRGASLLYSTVRDFAGLVKDKVVYDLYCGTGTIAQILAKEAKLSIGVELVQEAVDSAIENATLNKLDNCQFIAGDVLKVIDNLNHNADLIVLDPPRDGVSPKALDKILRMSPSEIIYVSCKPSSLARDLPFFTAMGYSILKLKCHDMFPRTKHVESVVLMTRKDC